MKNRTRKNGTAGTLGYQSLEPRQVLAAPVAIDDSLTFIQDVPQDLGYIVANDTDADKDNLTITSVTQPTSGAIAFANGEVTYTPNTGFVGSDQFTYTVSDGTGNQDTANVSVLVNAEIDIDAARTQILSGVGSVLPSPNQPGRLLTFGDSTFSILHADGSDSTESLFAGASFGNGRVIATNDHQWLAMDGYGDDASMAALYTNGIDWLAKTSNGSAAAKSAKIVTLDADVATWIADQGYTNVSTVTWATMEVELADADVLVGFLGSNVSAEQAAVVSDYVNDGGGLYVSDYGVGYRWWWNKPLAEAGGNRIMNQVGIYFTSDLSYSSAPVEVEPTTGQVTAQTIEGVFDGSLAVSAAESDLAFKTFAKILTHVPANDTTRQRLNGAFVEHRLGQVQATPDNPITSDADQAILTAEASWLGQLSIDEVPAHPTAAALFGEIPADTVQTSNQVFTVGVDRTGLIATGAYAVPGEIVTIQVPDSLVGQGYKFRINGHVDNISRRSAWVRLPYNVSTAFDIDSNEIRIVNAFGGTIYLETPGQAAGTRPTIGDTGITISGAVEAPTFVLGEMTNAQWMVERQKPGAYAELISDGLAMSVPSSWIRTLNNPVELLTYWDDIVDFADWVGGVEELRTGPERFNVDVQISAGLLHAGYPIQGPTWASEELVDLQHLEERGNWGYFHELGHEKQRHNVLGHGYNSAWTFDGDTEVTVNIFANAALELKVPNSPTSGWGYSAYPDLVVERAAGTINDADRANFEDKDPYPFYFQLADGPWGWQGYRDVLSTYNDQYLNDPDALPQTNEAEKDQWLIRWSQATGYDMTEYMVDNWKLEVSQSALDEVAAMNLPSWMPLAIDRLSKSAALSVGETGVLNLSGIGRSIDGVATLVSVSEPANGTLSDNGDGTWNYTANANFIGSDAVTLVLESSAGNRQAFDITLETSLRGIQSEIFTDIGGAFVSSLTSNAKFPDSPDRVERLTDFEMPADSGNDFGVRARGYVTVPVTGAYTFWIASDDRGELYLSTDTNPTNKTKIASVNGFTGRNQFDKYSSQKSVEVQLQANTSYYIEALMKEGSGGDNLSVAWSSSDPETAVVGISQPTVIESKYLTVFGVAENNINSLYVTNTNDSGVGSLRAAIEYANLLPGAQVISFHLDASGAAGPHKIELLSALPVINDQVSIDGTTQAGYAGQPLIEIDGSQVLLPIAGVDVAASDTQIKALSIVGFRGSGIRIESAERVKIEKNYIGIDTQGVEAANGTGVRLQDADFNTLIDNVISGNDFAGVELRGSADDNTIENNKIGTTIAGDAALGNYVGVHNVALRNKILDNLIAGNTWAGVALVGPTTGGDTTVQGNLIGSNEQSVAIPNESLGVFVTSSRNQIGGTESGDRNVISGNGNIGVLIRGNADNRVVGNHVGIDSNGLALGNSTTGLRIVGSRNVTVQENVISSNGTVGLFVGGINSPNATVSENHIGVSVNGRQDLGNGTLGMILNGAPDARIAENVIAGNERGGVYAVSGDTRFEFVGNRVGTDVSGRIQLINRNYGLYIRSNGNQIGTVDQPNVITSDGIGAFIHGNNNQFDSNSFGTDLTGELDLGMRMGVFLVKGANGNQIVGNSFSNLDTAIRNRDGGTGNSYANNQIWNIGRFVIDNGMGGIQVNDEGDVDAGPNDMINRPEIERAWISSGLLNVEFSTSLGAGAAGEYRFEFVATDRLGRSSRVWGVKTLAAAQLSSTTTVQLPADALDTAMDLFVAAHLTDSAGSTSELSEPFAVELL